MKYLCKERFDWLTPGEVYTVRNPNGSYRQFWCEARDSGTFLSSWQVERALSLGQLELVA